ncbi:DUF4124 domain-containing protein [Ferrimonas lipolytica]|uniref:DUF4124 domain-containing protein n=1 Tax=Ferrimonas lipolytica TaxID=2724191 RepID=A0A6H1UCR6_9GAMM|nr:DUF4124 domain-containing protein [Ferrimonas lipolytica]QIZ76875.1 DUF4124 domain-containing protein [Ferrimonas lipolytica]
MRSLVILLILVSCPAWSTIYKWVDEQGQVHYSELAPLEGSRDLQEFVPEKPRSATVVTRLPPDRGVNLSEQAEQLAQELDSSIIDMAYNNQPLDCNRADGNITSSLAMLKRMAQKKYKNGDITEVQLVKVQHLARQLNQQSSPSQCRKAVTNEKAFYKCMSSDHSHVFACLNKYRPR